MVELGRRMSASEFAEWIAYSHVEPFGQRRADQRAWLQVGALGNAMSGIGADLSAILPEFTLPETPEEVALQIHEFFEKMAAAAAREEAP